MKRTLRISVLVCLALSFAACGPPPYEMTTPAPFKRFEESRDFKMITPDGVMLKAREVDNYPEASLEFWADAMAKHLEAQGYLLKTRECFETDKGLDGCTLDFLLPHGAEDWVMSETLFVVDDTVFLLETAGPYDRFTAVEEALKEALRTFDPKK